MDHKTRYISDLKATLSSFVSGVTVVTTRAPCGSYKGFTASSFTPVSLDPPLILVSLSKSLSSYSAFAASEHFAINILAHDQRHLASIFSKPSLDRFEGLITTPSNNGNPLFPCVSAWIDCKVVERIDAGDHTLYLGSIDTFENFSRPGLAYVRQQFFNSETALLESNDTSRENCSTQTIR